MQEQHKQLALRYLGVRMRSEWEMRQYLAKKGVPEEDRDAIIAYLYGYHYLDDAQFAECYIRDKLRFHPCGRAKLVHDLRQKGLDPFIIDDALEQELPREKEEAMLRAAYARLLEKGKSREQALRHLYGKGYSAALLSDLSWDGDS